ncbi:MAG: serine/threonine protein kinase, partial [Pseudonocardiaceae bacterium]|nr:serine/threonine protein kinase [Pseudonocardiaceae bacterium]
SEAMTEETRGRAMREARIAARLQHRNAIALFDVAEHEGDPILVMEFLPSKSLSVVLEERGTLTPGEAAEIGAQVADALSAAHAVGIAHRDVKPGNILLAENGTVKITDFGISRALDDGTVTTQTGMLAGTPAYLAPEIARGADPSRASDVFSLGATLYHAIEGQPPFGTNSNPLALLHAVASGNVPPPRNAGPLAPTLMSLMRVDPAERPSMRQAATALATAPTVQLPPEDAPETPPRPAPAPIPAQTTTVLPRPTTVRTGPARKNVLIAAGVALVVLAGTLVAVLALNSGRDPGTRQAGPPADGGSSEQRSQSSPESPPSTSSSPAVMPNAGTQIGYSEAGVFVIDYYSDIENSARRWQMLSPNAQAVFGDEQGFQQYWAQYTHVTSNNANGVTPNPDGSLNVPLDVTYTSATGPRTEKWP